MQLEKYWLFLTLTANVRLVTWSHFSPVSKRIERMLCAPLLISYLMQISGIWRVSSCIGAHSIGNCISGEFFFSLIPFSNLKIQSNLYCLFFISYRWYLLNAAELKRRNSDVARPFPSPAMAGGLFSIDRKYFFEIGSYDKMMKIWGGDNLEMSFRIWMCGGRIEIGKEF